MELRPYQQTAVDAAFAALEEHASAIIVQPTGCHVAGQGILLYDGTVKKVEDIQLGDALMGPDSLPRHVVNLCRGEDEIVEIKPRKGQSWYVNHSHVLTLVKTPQHPERPSPSNQGGAIIDVSIPQWKGWSHTAKHIHKLFRTSVTFSHQSLPLPLDPYFLGVLLGDGTLTRRIVQVCKPDREIQLACEEQAHVFGMSIHTKIAPDRAPIYNLYGTSGAQGNPILNILTELGLICIASEQRFVPSLYKTATQEQRLALIAGLLDTDGSHTCKGYDFISKSRQLAEDLTFLCRSVGLAAYVKPSEKWCQTGAGGIYWRVFVSGDCTIIPCRIPRKQAPERKQKKSTLRTGFQILPTGERAPYYGFTLTGDGRYLLDDFTVTHNTGKTCVAAKIAERFRPQGRILFLADQEELIKQTEDKIKQWTNLSVGIEQASQSVAGMFIPDVTVASIQTLSRASRMGQFDPHAFRLTIVDECDRGVTRTYQAVYRYFPSLRLGLTATPFRADKKALGSTFEHVAFVYDIRDAIEQQYLVPIRQMSVEVSSIDLSKVKTTAGDLDESQLEALMMEEQNLHEVADPTVKLMDDRPTIVFCTTIKHAEAQAEVLNRYKPNSAMAISGQSTHREKILRDFAEGRTQFLANCALLTRGVDIPPVSGIALARPTKSKALFVQMVGRGTRLSPETGKTDLLVLDYVGNSGAHNLITVFDIMDGNMDLEVKARAQTLSKKNPQLTILESLEKAAEELANEQRQAVLAKAKFHTVEVDPFTVLGIHPRAGRWGGQEISVNQIVILEKAGIPWTGLDKGQASEVIGKIFNRREQGLCTVKMAKTLMRYGLNPDVPFEVASKQLNAIAQNGWKLTLAQQEQIARLAA